MKPGMKLGLEVYLSDVQHYRTCRDQMIESGLNGLDSGAITGFRMHQAVSERGDIAEMRDGTRHVTPDVIRQREAAAIRWAASQVLKMEVTHYTTPGEILTAVYNTLGVIASSVEGDQVSVP